MITPQLYQQIDPLGYERKFLEAKIRSDGRESFGACKELVQVSAGVVDTAVGSASARIGNTSVIVGVTAGVFTPPEGLNHANPQGKISVTCDCSLIYPGERRAAQSEGAVIARKLETVFNDENIFDKSQLYCKVARPDDFIELEGAAPKPVPVWDITVNIMVVRDEGSVTDCALLGAVQAIACTKLPTLTADLTLVESRDSVQLRLSAVPHCVTICQYLGQASGENHWLVDPSKEEEAVLPRITIITVGEKIVSFNGLESPRLTGVNGGDTSFSIADVISVAWPLVGRCVAHRTASISF